MIDILYRKNIQLLIILLHIIVGYLSANSAYFNGLFYIGITLYFLFDIIYTRDRGSRAGFYALYIMGFEIVYRVSGSAISDELGKYLSIIVLIIGILSGRRRYVSMIFVFAFVLLIPAIFLTDGESITRIRKLVLFNISGPLTLIFSGIYFYKRRVKETNYNNGLRLAFYPAVSLLMLLSINAGFNNVEYESVSSSFNMSGGFAPNQVSTGIGWFFLLGLVEITRGNRLLVYVYFDVFIVMFILMRGLLTMSRGGMLGAVLALLLSLTYAFVIDSKLRLLLKKIILPSFFVIFILFAGIWYVNKLSNNYILYRYIGKTTSEVRTGKISSNKDYTTGRGKIIEGDIAAFMEYPILGVGYGMASRWHAMFLGQKASAHTEFSRLLSENGTLGLIFLLLCYIIVPFRYFFTIIIKNHGQLHFIAFLVFSYATMFHGAMRLAIPGVLYGAAFLIISEKRKKTN